ncbi:hypothetical protein [Flavobacterium fluviatile]|uniref:hypothetical protein n=1 Tax=Flavobacterium fluviatile TaxID=1862387 RepID=UPI0013D32BAE|nr:hypothetical protein [Flavobacterium fluviatile]
MDILLNFISAIIGGLIVWAVQQLYQNNRENKKSKHVQIRHKEKILDFEILEKLKPGMHIDLMKEYFGNPYKLFKDDDEVFNEKLITTNSYLYSFRNADIKITSKDNLTIDTVTVFPRDKTFNITKFVEGLNLNSSKINLARVNEELLSISEHTFIAARLDYCFALKYRIANPLYLTITLFGVMEGDFHEYFETEDPNLFLNGLITGICISEYTDLENENIFYIYEYELR